MNESVKDETQVGNRGPGGRAIRIVQVMTIGSVAKSFLCEHYRQIIARGYDLTFISCDDDLAKVTVEATGAKHISLPFKQTMSPLSDLINMFRLARILRRLKPDIVHGHMSKGGILIALSGWLARVPVRIYHNHGMAMLSAKGFRRLLLRAVEWTANRFATHTLFCGKSARDAAVEMGFVKPERGLVLGGGTISGVNTDRFSPGQGAANRPRQREAWGVDDDTIVIGFVMRFVAHKGVDTAIDAWRRLDPEVRRRSRLFLIGGYTHADPYLRRLVEEAEAEGINLKFVGWFEDMVKAYAGIDILILPSWHEGFACNISEAQSMAIPVIATRVSGNVDAVQDELNGLLVPVRDPDALAAAMTRLINSPEDRRRLGDAAREHVLKYYREPEVIQNMMDFYASLIPAESEQSTQN